jgi:hypothetical protein
MEFMLKRKKKDNDQKCSKRMEPVNKESRIASADFGECSITLNPDYSRTTLDSKSKLVGDRRDTLDPTLGEYLLTTYDESIEDQIINNNL